jgi:hypothetical protein
MNKAMRTRLVCAPLMALVLTTLALVGGPLTSANAAACASPSKSIGGAFTGEDGRRLSAAIGVVIFDGAGNPINAQGCPKQPGDDAPTGYSFYTLVNGTSSGCCFTLPAAGADPSNSGYANSWRIDGLPSNAAFAWIEAYPKSNAQNATDYSRYGGAMRRMVSVGLDDSIRLPLSCSAGGSSGTITGRVVRNGAPVSLSYTVAFSLAPENTGQIIGFVASNDATSDGHFSIPSLASNQNYGIEFRLTDGSLIWYENDYGVGAPVTPCGTTSRTFAVQPNGTAVASNAVASGAGAVDTGNGGTIFFRGDDGQLWMRWANSPAEAVPLGGQIIGEPDATTWGGGRIDIVARGTDNAVWHRFYDGANWGPWESLGGTTYSPPTAVSWGPNRLDVFVAGADRQLWQRAWSPAGWTGWIPLGGVLTSGPDAASWATNRLDIVARGGDGAVWHRAWGGAWSGWEWLGGSIIGRPTAASSAPGSLDIVVRGLGDGIYRKAWNGGWTDWSSMGGQTDSDPAGMVRAGVTTIIVRGQNWQLYRATRPSPGGTFGGWTPIAG